MNIMDKRPRLNKQELIKLNNDITILGKMLRGDDYVSSMPELDRCNMCMKYHHPKFDCMAESEGA